MVDSIYLSVPGQPVGKGRPRFGNGRAYTPKKTKDYEDMVARLCREKMEMHDLETLEVPMVLHLIARFEIPKSWPKKKKELAQRNLIHPKKPDIDNVIKIIMDGMNGHIYEDDSQVYIVKGTKQYSDVPGVTVFLSWGHDDAD